MLVIEAVCGLEESGTGRENDGTASKKVCLFGAGRGNGWMVGRCGGLVWQVAFYWNCNNKQLWTEHLYYNLQNHKRTVFTERASSSTFTVRFMIHFGL